MLKWVAGLAALLVVAGSARVEELSHQGAPRQDASHRRLGQADLNVLADARIAVAQAMLQLTPDQAKYWPPVEEAIRNSAEARYRRIAQLRAMAEQPGAPESDPVAVMRNRAAALSERGANLKRLAEAWQPLYETLNPEQQDRMRLVVSHVLGETRGATGRRMDRPEAEGQED